MEKFNRIKTTALDVGNERVIAASEDVLTNQRKTGRRITLEIYNNSEAAVYFGGKDVTVATGIPILPDERRIFPVDNTEGVYLIAESTTTVVIAEYCL